MTKKQTTSPDPLINNLKQSVWVFGASCWLLGIVDRSIASLADGHLSASDITQLATVFFFFISWLFLKPSRRTLQASENSD